MADENIEYNINVTNAFKSFGGNDYVLNGLNMKVKPSSIYALLGASGCGKSTLLQSILGTLQLDSGSIDLKANYLVDVGYMPQDLCLENTLTIKETFEYFGSLYNMTKTQIENRVRELNNVLHIPNINSYVKDLSGGQCRRVSIGVSLLHNPKIIILDEPTVGIDPLLRNEIWSEFIRMAVQENKTIIITTHYIEEAYQANYVGLMRNGILVEEGTPQNILKKHKTESLESAFLTLCFEQESNKDTQNTIRIKPSTVKSKKLMKSRGQVVTSRVKALLKKNYLVCSRDYMLLFNMLILPILQAFNLCVGVGVNFEGMSIAIKNDEIDFLNCQSSNIDGCIFDKNNNQKMSCVFLNHLVSQHDYKLVSVEDRVVGEMSMNNPKFVAFMYFPKNFTSGLTVLIDRPKSYTAESMVYVHITKENLLFRNQITLDVTNSFNYIIDKSLADCSSNPKSIGVPIAFHTLVGTKVNSYIHSIAAIIVAMAAFYFPSIYSISFMLSEKMDGVLSRSMFAGVTILELFISMFIINTVTLVVQMVIPLLIAYVLFMNPIQITHGLFVYVFIMLLLGWLGFFFGLLIAGLSSSKVGGVYVITGWSFIQFTLSGALWPVEGQPPYLRAISKILPLTVAGKTLNNIALKGWTFAYPGIKMGVAVTSAYTISLLIIIIVVGRLKKDMWVIRK